MKGLLKIILLLIWTILSPNGILAQESQSTATPTPPKEEKKPIEITADAMQQDTTKNIIKAKGNVVISYEGKTIKADRLIVNTVTGKGVAVGHVIITDVDMNMKADRSRFNLKTHQGKLYNVDGVLSKKSNIGLHPVPQTPGSVQAPTGVPPMQSPMNNLAMAQPAMPPSGASPLFGALPQAGNAPPLQKVEYYVKGQELTKLGENHYKTVNTTLTTCKGNLPDWLIQTKTADLKVGDRALFNGGIFKVRDVPLLYIPAGYISLDNERKSGFLMPVIGNSSINGFSVTNSYYWAINEQSDATIFADYMGTRGVRPAIEYRYTPSKTTNGLFYANYLQDQSTNATFYKVNWGHSQRLESNIAINGKLDLVGDNNPDKTFNDNTLDRTRRNTDSFLSANKTWGLNSLDVTTRYRHSTDNSVNDTFGTLPQATFKTQKSTIGNTPFYFSQDSSAAVFYTNLTPTASEGNFANVQRYDFHPQVSLPVRPTPWLSVTPTVGFRETYYSQGIDASNNRYDGFSRELFDFNTIVEGPKFTRIFADNDKEDSTKLKHLIEPRLAYTYLANNKETENRNKTKVFDNIDTINGVNRLTYYFTQRLLQKRMVTDTLAENREVLKFEVSQFYDFTTVEQITASSYYNNFIPGEPTRMRQFSPVRFDLNSRLIEALMLNANTTYDMNDNQLRTFNVELGLKPTNSLAILLERRYSRDLTTFLIGSATLNLPKGWKLQYTSRFDELADRLQENDASLGYNDPCKCWGLAFDFIKRYHYNLGLEQPETKFMFRLNLLGLGTFGSGQGSNTLHRTF